MRRQWQIGILAVLAGGLVLGGALLGRSSPAEAGVLEIPAGAPAGGQLRAIDIRSAEVGCRTRGTGQPAGDVQVTYDANSKALGYAISIRGAAPHTSYLLDVAECGPGGERLARGDGGHLTTDAHGDGSLQGTWTVRAPGARWAKASLVPFCPSPDGPPTIPCGDTAYATDALLPPGR